MGCITFVGGGGADFSAVVGNARTDGVRQLSGQRAKDSSPGDEMVADECKAS
jgi:hypothetical protein